MTEAFSSRVGDVFAALDAHNPHGRQPEWRVSSAVPAASGDTRAAAESEDEDAAEHSERIEVLRQVEQQEGGTSAADDRMPSVSACKAFEAEEEEDAYDRVAAGTLHGLDRDLRPALDTQVPDEGADAPCRHASAADAAASDDTTAPLALPSSPALQRALRPSLKKAAAAAHRTPKRVRFSEQVGVRLIDSEEEPGSASPLRYQRLDAPSPDEDSDDDEGFSVDGASLDEAGPSGAPAAALPAGPRQSATPAAIDDGAPRRSYVPEHVRRPEAFTCYALEAPIVVGSGDDGASATERATAQAQAATPGHAGLFEETGVAKDDGAMDAEEPPAAVEFVPRCEKRAAGGDEAMREAGEGAGRGAVSFGDGEDGESGDDSAEVGGLEPKPQRRRLRARGGDDDQE